MEESNDSCGPLKRDDIKVSIKYFSWQWEQPRKHQEITKRKFKPKPWLFVYSTAFLAVTMQQHAAAGQHQSWLLQHTCENAHLNADHHVTPKQLQLGTASQCYLTEQNVMVAAGTQNLLQCTPNINKQCLLANAFKSFFSSFFCCWFDSSHGWNLIMKVH